MGPAHGSGVEQRQLGAREQRGPGGGVDRDRPLGLGERPGDERLLARARAVVCEPFAHPRADVDERVEAPVGEGHEPARERGEGGRGGDRPLGDDRFRVEVEAPVQERGAWIEPPQDGGDERRERGIGADHDRVEAAEGAQAPGRGGEHEGAVREPLDRARLAPGRSEHALDRDPVPALGARKAGLRVAPRPVAGERGDLPAPAPLLDGEVAEHAGADDVVGVEEVIDDEESGHAR